MDIRERDIIFVFGNPISKVESMSREYGITVLGTNTPQNLVKELSTANDVSHLFFVVTDEEELMAVNHVLRSIVIKPEKDKEVNIFLIVYKKFINRIKTGTNRVYVREFDSIDEDLIKELIINTTIHNQVQYFLEREEKPVVTMTKDKMARAGRVIDSFQKENILDDIKQRFGEMKKNQDYLTVTNVLTPRASTGVVTEEKDYELKTQEFLKEKEGEIIDRLKAMNSKVDLEDAMEVLLEIYNMRAEDLKDTAILLMDKIVEEGNEEKEKAKEESLKVMEEIEMVMLEGDKKQIDKLLANRDLFVNKVREVENKVMEKANTIKTVTVKYIKDLKESSSQMLLGEYREILPTERLLAFQETYKDSSRSIVDKSSELANQMTHVIDDLQEIVRSYSKIVDIDTNIIESQQRMVETLTTQRVVEKVEYSNSLTAKLMLLVSPTPNLGASTMLRVFSHKWDSILVLDFREKITNPSNFKEIKYSEFMKGNISDISGGYVKINAELARVVDENEIKERLVEIEGGFESIIVLVDKYMTVGVPLELVERIIYLSDASDSNLMEVNMIGQMYEPLFELNKRMFILNKATLNTKNSLEEKLIVANIDPKKVRVNVVLLSTELIDGKEIEYKLINSKFHYF